ncbi:hybrid sensor histidine kinase/response regulator [Pyxidicoccus xibeiensis]|uniref:hybrid sensor histidine kinase/response regulator n=1 Tax=Pyxidicoccus xibeiensis TaxID=2906759 RepID=UPI0020A7D0A6|nr:ATP-binding protein [Pyxidicoccus xibeiensis]MCP3135743.1 ATP-binding protein [Pyxidicoccus xibeiensis]
MTSKPAVILNVNDDVASRYVTSRVLGLAGFRVVEAGTGREALALVDEHTDLVILDVRLPDISGLEVCRRMKAAPRTHNVLVLHLSAQAVGPGDRAMGLEHGADGYLVAPVDPEELVAQVHALLRLRKAEREVRALSQEVEHQRRLLEMAISNAAEPIILYDGTGRVVFANQALYAARGAHSVHGPGKTLDGMLAEDPSLESYTRLVREALRTGQVQRGSIVVTSSNQGLRHYDFVISPSVGPGGEVVAVMSSSRDVTEERSAEEFREQFIGMLGHDLRNPLNALSMSAQQLQRRGGLDERQAMLTSRILTSADRMDRMIRQLLDFARARLGGGIPVVRVPGDIFDVVRRTLDELRASHPGRVLLLEVKGDGRGEWDTDRLEQALGNLVANALKYSPADGPVQVQVDADEQAAVVRVHNGGPPIPTEELPHVFSAWRRGKRARSEAGTAGGLGLGLYITSQIVRGHGGDVQVSSSAEGGTTFTVRLPR